ncbi:MAG: EamA family transporter [Gemmatimonadaceae bacterium]
MDIATIALVLASSATHAYWNFLIKRSAGGSTFIGLSKVVEVVVFAPAFLWWSAAGSGVLIGAWWIVVGGAMLALLNYVALAKAYETGDLSVVYPVARGATLLFLPALGFVVFGEHISAMGWLGIGSVMAGIAVIRLPAFSSAAVRGFAHMLRSRSIAFALIAAAATAGYTVWDKNAVQTLPTFTYFYSYTAMTAVLYLAYLSRRVPRGALTTEWREKKWPIIQVGVLNTVSYLLVLIALRSGTSSYVLALRQLSIGIGVFLGWRLLREDLALPKRVGVGLLVAGCLLVGVAR